MQIGNIDNSTPNFTGYVDSKVLKTIERTAHNVTRKYMKNANKNHQILKQSELETIASYRSLPKRLEKYMDKLSTETTLTVTKKQDGFFEFIMQNPILNTSLWFPRRGLGSKKVANYLIDISAPYFSKNQSKFSPYEIKVTSKDSDRFMKMLNEYVENLEKVDPKEIDLQLFKNSQKQGSINEIRKRIENNLQKPYSLSQQIDYNANVDMYNKMMKLYGNITEKTFQKKSFGSIMKTVFREKINYLKEATFDWILTMQTRKTNNENLKNIEMYK